MRKIQTLISNKEEEESEFVKRDMLLKLMKHLESKYNKGDQISYSEFIAATIDENILCQDHIIECTFNQFDRSGTGQITPEILLDIF